MKKNISALILLFVLISSASFAEQVSCYIYSEVEPKQLFPFQIGEYVLNPADDTVHLGVSSSVTMNGCFDSRYPPTVYQGFRVGYPNVYYTGGCGAGGSPVCNPDPPYYRKPYCQTQVVTQVQSNTTCAGNTAANGEKDGDEDGIDCGGSTGAECQLFCMDGKTELTFTSAMQAQGWPNMTCASQAMPDSFGNCPTDWSLGTTEAGDSVCVDVDSFAEPVLASQQHKDENPPDAPASFNTYTQPSTTTTTSSAPTVVNTPGGEGAPAGAPSGTGSYTEKQIVTTTGGGSGGSGGTSTTTIRNYYSGSNGTGELLGEETTTTAPPSTNAENYQTTGLNENSLNTTIEAPEQTDIIGIIGGWLSSYPLISMVQSFTVTTSATECSIPIPSSAYWSDLSIDFCKYETFLRTVGAALVVFCQGYAVLIIIRGWR